MSFTCKFLTKEETKGKPSTHKLKDTVAEGSLPSSLSHASAKNHISRAVLQLTYHFFCHYVAQTSPVYHFHCLTLPSAASLPHFCPPLLPPSILRDSGQGLLQFPLLMASSRPCGQTSAVSVLVPGSGTYFSFLKHQAKVTRKEKEWEI